MINPMDLTGKKIMIVGTTSKIGKAITQQISALGATIVMVDTPDEQELVPEVDGVKQYAIDYLDTSSILPTIKTIVKAEGKLDGFVYTVIHSDFRPLAFVDNKNLRGIMNDNFDVFIELTRSLNKSKGLSERASMVVMSSISSVRAMKAKMAFCASKAATDAAVRCLASELGEKGIRVNSVQKGCVDVDMEKDHIQSITAINNNATEDKQVLGLVKAEEIGNTVAFLLSDAARSITGTSIVVDGGYLL